MVSGQMRNGKAGSVPDNRWTEREASGSGERLAYVMLAAVVLPAGAGALPARALAREKQQGDKPASVPLTAVSCAAQTQAGASLVG